MFDRTRPRAAMLAVALAAVVCATAMAPAAAREGAREAATANAAGMDERFRIMSYNIQAGTGADRVFDLERTARAIEAQRPDAVALQEVDVNWSPRSDYVDEANWLATRLRMRVFFAPIYTLEPEPGRPGAPPRRFGLAVLSRHPILRAYNHEITRLSTQVPDPVPAPAPGFPEVLLNVRGTPVWLYGTHLDYRGDPAIRRAQVADTLRIMGRRHGHRLLLGDFNAAPEAAELAPLWRSLRDALTLAGRPDAPTYPAAAPTKRLDYVTVSATPGLRVRGAWVPDTLASDHRPVVADVDIRR